MRVRVYTQQYYIVTLSLIKNELRHARHIQWGLRVHNLGDKESGGNKICTSRTDRADAAAAEGEMIICTTGKTQLGVVVVVVVGSGRAVAVLPVRSRPGNIRHATHTKQLVFVCRPRVHAGCAVIIFYIYLVKHCLRFLSTRNDHATAF